MSDLISRQEAIDVFSFDKEMLNRLLDNMDVVGTDREKYSWGLGLIESYINDIWELPSAQLTLSGYNIKHLELIARILQKEGLPPEKIAEVLTDIGRIVAIIKDEFEETLRKAAEQCTILISRQAASDAIRVYMNEYKKHIGMPDDSEVFAHSRGMLCSIANSINALPSAKLWDIVKTVLKELEQKEERLYSDYWDTTSKLKAIDKIAKSSQTPKQKIEGIRPLAEQEVME